MSEASERERSALSAYMNQIKGISRLTEKEEKQLRRDLVSGDPRVAARLVRSHLGFAVKVALEYRGMGLHMEDLLAEANLGLLEAARRFDVHRGCRFTTYAIWWIRKAILNAISARNDLIRFPSGQLRRFKQFREAEQELQRSLGREPSREEVSRHLSMSVREVERMLQRRARVVSIDQKIREEDGDTLEHVIGDARVPTPEQRMLDREGRRNLLYAVAELPHRERMVLSRRFGLGAASGGRGETLNDIATQVGLSRERVRQIESQARKRLKKLLGRRFKPAFRSRGPTAGQEAG
jgi:RNA polymerase sigma factor (sigma-70 family)